tara:strand:- start:876 stop:1076 length:201 start_codon:yes stop_codon:yes gene_type:complete
MKGILENDEDLFGTISWDGKKEEGVVAFHPDFMEAHPLKQLDALLDWGEAIQSTYNAILKAYETKH